MKYLSVKIVILLSIIGFSSCNPQKRIQRIVKRNPHLIKKDTILVHDTTTVLTERIEHDTVFNYKETHYFDTVKIVKDKLKVEFIKLPNDTIKVFGTCESDTITLIKEIKVPFEKIQIQKKGNKNYFLLIILACICFLLAFKVVKK